MLLQSIRNKAAFNLPVIVSDYGFAKTCYRVYNSTYRTPPLVAVGKGILINCSMPIMKYPALCYSLVGWTIVFCITADPKWESGVIACGRSIIWDLKHLIISLANY